MQYWHMAKSIIISLGGGLEHLGHFGHFDCLPCFNFFDHSEGVSGLGDSSSNGSPDSKSNDNSCEWYGSEGRVIKCSLIPEPSISSSNSMINWWCFEAMTELEIKKKRCKSAGERMVKSQQKQDGGQKANKQGQANSRHVWINGANPDILEELWKKRRKL